MFQIPGSIESSLVEMFSVPTIPYRRNFNSFLSNPNYDFQYQFLIFLNSYAPNQQFNCILALQLYGEIDQIFFAQVILKTKQFKFLKKIFFYFRMDSPVMLSLNQILKFFL